MTQNQQHFIRYTDDVEVKQPGEDEQTREVVESMARVNRMMFDKHRHAIRDAHAKSHGILRGNLQIYPNLPEHLAQGKLTTAAYKALNVVGIHPEPNTIGAGKPNTQILGETFFSMAAVRYGDYIAKISAAPLSENLKALAGQEIDRDNDSILRDLVVDFFQNNTAEYELRVQLCTDLSLMPVEDGSVEWPQELSPYHAVGKITIPPQEAYSPARRVYGDDVLSFNPFHCIPAHRPLGGIMRVRRLAYETSSKYRHLMNAQPRIEPRSINELPE